MLYQLPNGKTISISVDQWLDMTDEDIQFLVSINYGDIILSPFYQSSIREAKSKLLPPVDNHIDYKEESEELESNQPFIISLDETPLDIIIDEDLDMDL